MNNTFLKTQKGKIVGKNNKPVFLRGVNTGGWLMMEAYFLHAPARPVKDLKEKFIRKNGTKEWERFHKSFLDSFIQESDIKNIAAEGFNCIRVPFHFNLIEKRVGQYDKVGINRLDQVIAWAKKYGVWVILDLHAVPGCQNHDWHSDSTGKADFWKKPAYQKRVYRLWAFLAKRYANETTVAGYDLLNEAVLKDAKFLNTFYKNVIKAIREVDQNHILFIEGNTWAQDVKCLEKFDDDNYVLSIHHYVPLEFTFNLVPELTYPLKSKGWNWDIKTSCDILTRVANVAKSHGVPIFVGEFGVNARSGKYGEDKWLSDILKCFKNLNFHWTYWTYKAVKNYAFPDGVYSYYENPAWVNRQGPDLGWETYPKQWPINARGMIESWKTRNFRANEEILKTLKVSIKG